MLERYFSGRATRPAFLFCTLFWGVVGIVLMLAVAFVAISRDVVWPDRTFIALHELFLWRLTTAGALALAIYALVSIPCARVAVLRLHDIGVSGWWAVAMFALVPFDVVASISRFASKDELAGRGFELSLLREIDESGVLLVTYLVGFVFCLFWPPTRGTNRFGPDPRIAPASTPTSG